MPPAGTSEIPFSKVGRQAPRAPQRSVRGGYVSSGKRSAPTYGAVNALIPRAWRSMRATPQMAVPRQARLEARSDRERHARKRPLHAGVGEFPEEFLGPIRVGDQTDPDGVITSARQGIITFLAQHVEPEATGQQGIRKTADRVVVERPIDWEKTDHVRIALRLPQIDFQPRTALDSPRQGRAHFRRQRDPDPTVVRSARAEPRSQHIVGVFGRGGVRSRRRGPRGYGRGWSVVTGWRSRCGGLILGGPSRAAE